MTDSPEARFWEEMYESGDYLSHWDYESPSQELVAAAALELFQSEEAALDIGCGSGREAVFLAECGLRVTGVDISAKALEIARSRADKANVEVDWRQGSFFELPLDDQSVDFINDRGALHLVTEADRPRFAGEVERVLKPGGRLLVRGASPEETEEEFTPITAESIDRHFPAPKFSRGPLLPITLVSGGGTLSANVVVVRKSG